MKVLLAFLQVLPWLCGILFVLAFFSPFDTPYSSSFELLSWSFDLEFTNILRTIAVAGLIGFGTNYLAIKMLFRPLNKRPIWGQGLIPGQRDRIIFKLAEGMHTHILSQELIRKRVEETGLVKRVNDLVMEGTIGLLTDEELRTELKSAFFDTLTLYASREDVKDEIRKIVDTKLETRLDKGIKKFVLQTYKRYNKDEYEEAINQLVGEIPVIAIEVLERGEDQLNRLAAYLRKEKNQTAERIMEIFVKLLNSIDITDLLAKQMAYLDERKLENMIWAATNEQLLYIQYLGTLLGMMGGLLIWEPVLTGSIFLITFGLLFGLDHLLFRFQTPPKP
ncbi:MAG: DUF445 domain-containing protein [Bacteroidia bacterium]|nr:DUF445 domain-containing protein [Bacteroidia bacterium]